MLLLVHEEKVNYKELEQSLISPKEVVPKKEKLSNNALQKLQDEANDIEISLDMISDKFNDPNTKYDEFNDLNEEKTRLETRYYEILAILENNR